MSAEVRRASLPDLPSLLALHDEVHQLHLAARPDQFKPVDSASLAARFNELLAASDTKIWVAELASAVIGYAVTVFMNKPATVFAPARRWCELDAIAVAKPQRRSGIAAALIRAALEDAHQNGVDQIELNSWAFNETAHEAFRALGFIPKHTRFELKR